MTEAATLEFTRERSRFDEWPTITLSLYITLVGYGVLVGIPVISTAWVELLGFTEEQVGRVAGADLGGLSVGGIITSLIITRFNRRYLILASAATAMGANYLCTINQQYDAVLWLRFVSGLGCGMYTAVAVAALGATMRPARAFNLMLFGFCFSQASEMRILPMLSMNGIYWFFILCIGASLLFIRLVVPWAEKPPSVAQARLESAAESDGRNGVPHYIPWLCLGAILVTYANIGVNRS